MTAAEIADRLRLARATVARWLRRMGLGRLSALEPRPPVIRHQRERPGELIHLDIKSLGRFNKPGHRVTGGRKGNRNRGGGWDCVQVAIDDTTRLAYVEVLADQKRDTTTTFLVRALRWFKIRGIAVERVMTDNGSPYVSRLFAKVLRWLGIRHIRTRPYTPRTNGKAERFIQTLLRKWAYAIPYRSSDSRNRDLARYLDWYNTNRPHYALSRQPPPRKIPTAEQRLEKRHLGHFAISGEHAYEGSGVECARSGDSEVDRLGCGRVLAGCPAGSFFERFELT